MPGRRIFSKDVTSFSVINKIIYQKEKQRKVRLNHSQVISMKKILRTSIIHFTFWQIRKPSWSQTTISFFFIWNRMSSFEKSCCSNHLPSLVFELLLLLRKCMAKCINCSFMLLKLSPLSYRKFKGEFNCAIDRSLAILWVPLMYIQSFRYGWKRINYTLLFASKPINWALFPIFRIVLVGHTASPPPPDKSFFYYYSVPAKTLLYFFFSLWFSTYD